MFWFLVLVFLTLSTLGHFLGFPFSLCNSFFAGIGLVSLARIITEWVE